VHTIDQALDYLYSFINYEVDGSYAYGAVHYNLDRTVELLARLGNPERHMDFIHVAGTKGKGSVCAIMDACLRPSFVTGLFTSPHIERVNERIQVNGVQIDDGEIISYMNKVRPFIAAFPEESLPTTFEILTAVAVYHFFRKGVRWSILETGMGGRFDSTNFCTPSVSVITTISFDHMDKLGTTIGEIAGEKAGIIKPETPVVVGFQRYDVRNLLREKASSLGSPVYEAGELCRLEDVRVSESGTRFNLNLRDRSFPDLSIPLVGRHQAENCATALLALDAVGLLPDGPSLREAVGKVRIPARLECIRTGTGRRFLLDSAHNEDSARVLVNAVLEGYDYERLVVVVGIVKGKDARGILTRLCSVADTLIVTEPVTHKDLDTGTVYETARNLKSDAVLIPDIGEAISFAVDNTGPDDIILITGSFYITSPARSITGELDKNQGERTDGSAD